MKQENASCQSPKACQICKQDRIQIGKTYSEISTLRRIIGVTFIYVPVIFVPFVILIACMTAFSLRILGAKNLKSFSDFVPAQNSHRYTFKNQIVMNPNGPQIHLGWKVFWYLNCNFYCPYTVALFEYLTYLIKAVENWWCPFEHSWKSEYASAALDKSYWHVMPGEASKLHPDDLKNPIWHEDEK